jgi:hypothetical protein
MARPRLTPAALEAAERAPQPAACTLLSILPGGGWWNHEGVRKPKGATTLGLKLKLIEPEQLPGPRPLGALLLCPQNIKMDCGKTESAGTRHTSPNRARSRRAGPAHAQA